MILWTFSTNSVHTGTHYYSNPDLYSPTWDTLLERRLQRRRRRSAWDWVKSQPPVKILVTKRPFDSTLESATATFGRQFKQRIARQPRTVVLANEICATCVYCRECLGYIKHERLQGAYNNYDGLTSASVTSMRQNSPMNVDYRSRGTFTVPPLR